MSVDEHLVSQVAWIDPFDFPDAGQGSPEATYAAFEHYTDPVERLETRRLSVATVTSGRRSAVTESS